MFKKIHQNTFERRNVIIVTNTSDVQTLTVSFPFNWKLNLNLIIGTSVLDLCSLQHHNYPVQLFIYIFMHIFVHIIYASVF